MAHKGYALSLLLAGLCACPQLPAASVDELAVMVCTDGPRLRRDQPWPAQSPVFDAAARKIELCGARNEVLGFQVWLKAKAGKISQVNCQASDLLLPNSASKIPASHIGVSRAAFVEVAEPSFTGDIPGLGNGEYPDPLVPLAAPKGGAPFELEQKPELLFVDLYIPHGTPAGTYSGALTLTAAGLPLLPLAVSVTVWDFTLPEENHFTGYFYYATEFLRWGFRTQDTETLEDELQCAGHRHRANLATDLSLRASEAEWEAWARKKGKYVDGSAFTESPGKGVGTTCWRLGIAVGGDEALLRQRLKLAADFLEKKGWLDRFAVSGFDEPKSAQFPTVKHVGQLVREATGGRLKHFLPGAAPDPAFQDYVDLWDGVWTAATLPLLDERRKAGQRIWFCGGLGASANPVVDSHPYGARSWPWVAFKYGFEGFEMWHSIYWVDKYNQRQRAAEIERDPEQFLNVWKNPAPFTFDEGRKRPGQARHKDDIRQNGGAVFFYPGYDVGLKTAVLPSLRLKDFRRGAQDYEYLWLLRQAGQQAVTEAILSKVYLPAAMNLVRGGIPEIKTGDVGVVNDENIWESVHREMGERLQRLLGKH